MFSALRGFAWEGGGGALLGFPTSPQVQRGWGLEARARFGLWGGGICAPQGKSWRARAGGGRELCQRQPLLPLLNASGVRGCSGAWLGEMIHFLRGRRTDAWLNPPAAPSQLWRASKRARVRSERRAPRRTLRSLCGGEMSPAACPTPLPQAGALLLLPFKGKRRGGVFFSERRGAFRMLEDATFDLLPLQSSWKLGWPRGAARCGALGNACH